nr:fad-dependent monooxygenase mdpd [Quercus suber]
MIGASATKVFRHWPGLQQKSREIAHDPLLAFHTLEGERVKGPFSLEDLTGATREDAVAGPPMSRHSRPKFHAMLLGQLQHVGISVEYGMEVMNYYENSDRAGVVLKDGAKYEADLVIAADGVRGQSWELIAGHPIPAVSSGDAVLRAAYPVKYAMQDSAVVERFGKLENGREIMEMWSGETMSWFITRPDRDALAAESWNRKVSNNDVLAFTATLPGWPDVADRVIKTTPPNTIIDWKLMWRDPQPTSVSPRGRVVQLGDAAHTFLPSSGNGATQAMEDAVSLAACLALAGRDSIAEATKVHNLLRFERVSSLQAFGVVNSKKFTTAHENAVAAGQAKKNSPPLHVGRWIWGHDPEQYVTENYASALRHLETGEDFRNSNTPPGHVYHPWTIDGLLSAAERGETTALDWQWD